jgi:hypothetical protein
MPATKKEVISLSLSSMMSEDKVRKLLNTMERLGRELETLPYGGLRSKAFMHMIDLKQTVLECMRELS